MEHRYSRDDDSESLAFGGTLAYRKWGFTERRCSLVLGCSCLLTSIRCPWPACSVAT